MSEICDRIRGLAADAGMTLEELAEAAGIAGDFASRVADHERLSSLEVARVAVFTGRDPLWILTGKDPQALLEDFLAALPELPTAQRHGFNATFAALAPFLPAHVTARVSAASTI